MALKRKKAYEGQIDRLMGSRMKIEEQVMAIENANVNLMTMQTMQQGAAALKNIHKNMYDLYNRCLALIWAFLFVLFCNHI
jgi:charged multivesicular body protein 4